MALILRQEKGSKLTVSEMDGNFTYLQSLALSGGTGGGSEFTGNTSSNTISDIWVDNLHGTGGMVNFVGSVTATAYYGDGSHLTGIVAGAGAIPTTYDELVANITGETLTAGASYIITDFQTCYDVPEYYVNGEAKGNNAVDYRQASVEPIVVFATSTSTISSTAYQPAYPKDRIQYDWTWNATEITEGIAFGRITERIDEYNNRTDYDHRNISFNRFQSYDKGSKLSGTLYALAWGQSFLIGQNTKFLTEVNPGDILLIDGYQFGGIGVKVVSAATDTQLTIVTDPTFGGISFCGDTLTFHTAVATEYFNEYKEVYVGQKNEGDWDDVQTFNLNGSAVHNYVGDYSKFYLEGNLSNSGFLLANNVFHDNSGIYSNTIGDRSYNNTARYWFLRNTIAGRFYNNVTRRNGFYGNDIGEYFYGNIIKAQMYGNRINADFNANIIHEQFYDNVIGNSFNDNEIYSQFYENQIGLYFESNAISDYGNSGTFEFYRNRIGNNFYNNRVRNTFQNNQVGNQFHDNVVNGEFYKNVIGNGFNNNPNIGDGFYGNRIGNGFNNNDLIGDNFYDNQIGEYFANNSVSYNFKRNRIGDQFENNTLGDTQYFNWNNTGIQNLTARTYSRFYDALDGRIDNNVLGKELIMHDTVNNQYHRVKFTQWTQGNVGGGFSYERTKVYPTEGPTVYFTKTNYGSQVDVIVEGSLEITRGNNGGIYNAAVQGGWNNNAPQGTLWNSIYTQSNNGNNFGYNSIGNEFKGNYIRNEFTINNVGSYVSGNQFSANTYSNNIGPYTFSNDFLGYVSDNSWGEGFYGNTFGQNFEKNTFGSSVYSNTVGDYFFNNQIQSYFDNNIIGDYFQNNQTGSFFESNTIDDNFGFGYSDPQGNKIGGNFRYNNVGEYFYNNTIPDNFRYNTMGPYFQWNVMNTDLNYTDFTISYGNIKGFNYTTTGTGATDDIYSGLTGATTGFGVGASFNVEVVGGEVVGVSGNSEGTLYSIGDSIILSGNSIYPDVVLIDITDVSSAPIFYQHQTKQVFERKGGNKRVSHYDENDVLNVDSVYENVGYIPVYSQSLTFPYSYTSFEFWCDGGYTNNGGTTNQTVSNIQQLVTLFNNNFRDYGYFFDNSDGTLGLYIKPSLKQQYCPNGTYSIYVYND